MLELINESNSHIFDELAQDYEDEFSPTSGKKKNQENTLPSSASHFYSLFFRTDKPDAIRLDLSELNFSENAPIEIVHILDNPSNDNI